MGHSETYSSHVNVTDLRQAVQIAVQQSSDPLHHVLGQAFECEDLAEYVSHELINMGYEIDGKTLWYLTSGPEYQAMVEEAYKEQVARNQEQSKILEGLWTRFKIKITELTNSLPV